MAALLHWLGPILTPFLIGAILAYFGSPLVTWAQRHRVPRALGTLLVIVLILLLLLALLLVLIPLVHSEVLQLTRRLPEMATDFYGSPGAVAARHRSASTCNSILPRSSSWSPTISPARRRSRLSFCPASRPAARCCWASSSTSRSFRWSCSTCCATGTRSWRASTSCCRGAGCHACARSPAKSTACWRSFCAASSPSWVCWRCTTPWG